MGAYTRADAVPDPLSDSASHAKADAASYSSAHAASYSSSDSSAHSNANRCADRRPNAFPFRSSITGSHGSSHSFPINHGTERSSDSSTVYAAIAFANKPSNATPH